MRVRVGHHSDSGIGAWRPAFAFVVGTETAADLLSMRCVPGASRETLLIVGAFLENGSSNNSRRNLTARSCAVNARFRQNQALQKADAARPSGSPTPSNAFDGYAVAFTDYGQRPQTGRGHVLC